MPSKKDLAVTLSRLKVFENPKLYDEQYETNSEIAAEIIWFAFLSGEIEDKIVADFGAGTGILGLGCLLCGAKKVYFVEKDKDAISILKDNIKYLEEKYSDNFSDCYEIIHSDISKFELNVDFIIQNPPFGTKVKHADKKFLEKAFSLSNAVYSFHKTSTESFVRAISLDYKFEVKQIFDFDYPIKKTQVFHKKKVEKIKVSCYRLVKENN
jgi:putative methylase